VIRTPRPIRTVLTATVIAGCLLATACLSKSRPVTAPPVPEPPPPPAESHAPPPAPVPPPQDDTALRESEERSKALELRLLEKESVIQDLKQRLDSQQRSLDEAIQEVVRAKAKMLSLESRAEAASQMAESEIAVKTLEAQVAGTKDPDLPEIRKLLQMSSTEFEKENFGGALYLTIQAKSRIQAAQLRLRSGDKVDPASGEIPFAAPITLTVAKASNVRTKPDLSAPILLTVAAGRTVTGYSHKGEWVRIVCEDGTRGWVHQSLLSEQ